MDSRNSSTPLLLTTVVHASFAGHIYGKTWPGYTIYTRRLLPSNRRVRFVFFLFPVWSPERRARPFPCLFPPPLSTIAHTPACAYRGRAAAQLTSVERTSKATTCHHPPFSTLQPRSSPAVRSPFPQPTSQQALLNPSPTRLPSSGPSWPGPRSRLLATVRPSPPGGLLLGQT